MTIVWRQNENRQAPKRKSSGTKTEIVRRQNKSRQAPKRKSSGAKIKIVRRQNENRQAQKIRASESRPLPPRYGSRPLSPRYGSQPPAAPLRVPTPCLPATGLAPCRPATGPERSRDYPDFMPLSGPFSAGVCPKCSKESLRPRPRATLPPLCVAQCANVSSVEPAVLCSH